MPTTTEETKTEEQQPEGNWLDVIAQDLGMAVGEEPAAVDDDDEEEKPKPSPEIEPEPETPPAPEYDEDKPLLPKTETTPDPVTALLMADDEEAKPKTEEPEKEEEKPEESPKLVVKKQPPLGKVVKDSVVEALEAREQALAAAKSKEEEELPELPAKDEFDGWSEDEIEQYELAKNAEALEPEKYKGLTESTKKFRDSVAEYIEREGRNDPHRSFDSDDEEFMQFVSKLRPAEISKRDIRRVREENAARRAAQMVRDEYDKKISELQSENARIRSQPKIEKASSRFTGALDVHLTKDDNPYRVKFVKEAGELGWDKFSKKYPTLAPVFSEEAKAGASMAAEFAKISEGVAKYDPENEIHGKLAGFVAEQGQMFKEKGGEARVRDGKTFVTRAEWAKLVEDYEKLSKAKDPKAKDAYEKASKHWTYSDDELLDLMAVDTKFRIDYRLQSEIDRVKASAAALGIHLNEDSERKAPPSEKVAKQPAPEPEKPEQEEPKSPVVASSMPPPPVPDNSASKIFSKEELRLLIGDA